MVLFAPGHKEFAQHVGVTYLSGEKPKSPLFTMKCCVIELCLLTAGRKSLCLVIQSYFNGTKGHNQTSFCSGGKTGALVHVFLLMLCCRPDMGERGESALYGQPGTGNKIKDSFGVSLYIYVCIWLCMALRSLLGWWV